MYRKPAIQVVLKHHAYAFGDRELERSLHASHLINQQSPILLAISSSRI